MVLGRTRGKAATPDIIVIDDTDSENEGGEQPLSKRQRTTQTSTSKISAEPPLPARMKNAHLKGRKRFSADIDDLKQYVDKQPICIHGVRVTKIRAGDDEGSVDVRVVDSTDATANITLVFNETSDYPREHMLFSYTDGPIHESVQAALATVAEDGARPLRETIERMLCAIVGKEPPNTDGADDDEEEEEDPGDYDGLLDDDDFAIASIKGILDRSKLQRDFIDVVASHYRPGLLRFSADDFCLSVSVPVIKLADSIPAQALMAWDRRLLSRSQHLVLLISGQCGIYPTLDNNGSYTSSAKNASVQLKFQVGLSGQYKPSEENAREAVRKFGLVVADAEDELRLQQEREAAEAALAFDYSEDPLGTPEPPPPPPIAFEPVEEDTDPGRFDKFSLSSSFEHLLDQHFLKVVNIRRVFRLGWAGAELLHSHAEQQQRSTQSLFDLNSQMYFAADKEEATLDRNLPDDPLKDLEPSADINLMSTAFSYLVRRMTLCTRYCLICHNRLDTDYEALKPYVCDKNLCAYQYYTQNRGPKLEYEILHNPQTVDLLVSIAYCSAAEGVLDDFPVGMGLRVPLPAQSTLIAQPNNRYSAAHQYAIQQPASDPPKQLQPDNSGLVEFDELSNQQKRASVAFLIDSLPAVDDMRKHLERKVKPGKSKPKLTEVDPATLPAAWSTLRWCVASCTAYLEPMAADEQIGNLDPSWKQFRFTVGAPDMEARFKGAADDAKKRDQNARKFPTLYAFHGSSMRNWHSIIRHGLWFKNVANGRAFGDGVYLAKAAETSMGSYAQNTGTIWKKSRISPTACTAVVEAVNMPQEFVSNNPHFVINKTEWLFCRYLLVKCPAAVDQPTPRGAGHVPFVSMDPKHPATFGAREIQIPQPGWKDNIVLQERRNELLTSNDEVDFIDQEVFEFQDNGNEVHMISDGDDDYDDDDGTNGFMDDDDDYVVSSKGKAKAAPAPKAPPKKPTNDWKHNRDYVASAIERRMPPPNESSSGSLQAVSRELKSMLKEQKAASSLKELGWYLPEEFIDDNLFSWIVELHSFDPDIPIAKDMKAKRVNSIIFEIRFPPTFPMSPPFFRILTPRFLPFIHGGGGHVTGGGSICMDLLTSNGWLPSYSIPAILLQIKLAISNLEPRPARLAQNWDKDYQPGEALEGYKRAANTHGWTVPAGFDKLVR
ncbi:hypothetical protein CYLTODRAFT_389638 [Cylindrobasidium torrendii FP15055 ss-10]|uniref:UBC core domain-containing protein n=1 Tax=Cylindrobasidium torrendii FP15055 ss-10 TaxID=1314674 RepID=A0A0D7BQM1_9AGAR|nr:hypothetical protein CYLTODRAFT_389638 [Cylindrobasidium torrendii FP15055 ss-10]